MKEKCLLLLWTIALILGLISSAQAQYFSLETPKIYSPGEKVVVNLSSQGIAGSIFFRAYKIENPMAFFQRQSDPHSPQQLLSVREANTIDILRSSRNRLQRDQRQVFRDNMSPQTRTTVKNTLGIETFSVGARANRLLSVLKDYPLLKTWEITEFKTPQEYSYRDVEIDLKEPGTYLIEGFNEKLMAHTIVVISRLGMITKSSPNGTLVFVGNKISGEPVAGVNLRLLQNKKELATAITDKNGLANFAAIADNESSILILGQKENDFVLSDPYYYGFGERRQYVVHAYTERPIYRPQQIVYFKGIVREATEERYEVFNNREVEVKVTDPRGNEIYRQRLKTNANGTFSGDLMLGEEPPLGTYQLVTSIPDGITHYTTFKVEEYKKPEFKVEVTTDKDQYANGDLITATIKADYYFGSPVANAQVDYYIFRGRFWRPWWYGTEYAWYYEDEDEESESYSYRAELLESNTGYLNANGEFVVTYQTPRATEDYYYRIEARVVDASRRQIIGSRQVEVTHGLFMISTYTSKYVYSPGEEATVNLKTEDFKHRPVSTKVLVEVYTREWLSGSGWQNKKKIFSQELTTDANGNAIGKFKTSEGGYYFITATAVDARGNKITSEDYCWVSAGAGYYSYQAKGIEIIPDKPSYQAGDLAHVLVISPVKNVWALVSAEGPTLFSQQVVHLEGTSQVIDLKIEEKHQPNFTFAVALLANDQFYTGNKNVIVIPEDKFLNIDIRTDKEVYRPQDNGELTIKVTNKDGKGVKTELSVGIVDESIYALAPDMTRDIKKVFYSKRYNRVSTYSSIYFRFYGYSRGLGAAMAAKAKEAFSRRGLADVKADKFKEARVRKDFRDTMFWQAYVLTNSDGIARLKIHFPDNLTTWRTTVRAISENTEVGEKIHKTLVRQDLIVRMETPRFFMQGDELTISTIVHNYLSQDKQAKVSLQGEGVQIDPAGEKIISVPQNGEKRVDWTVRTTGVGTATLTTKALTNEVSDAMQLNVPVLPHGLKMSETTTVDIEEDRAVKEKTIVIPITANPATAELFVSLSPSLASSMLSALEDLAGYPYGCVEQTMSRFLPTAVVAYTAKKLNLNLRLELLNELPKMIDKGLKALYNYQHGDGGWGWWENDQTHPYMTAYVVYGLALAKQAGYSISEGVLTRGANNLARQLTQAKLAEKTIPGLWNGGDSYEYIDATTQAYMLYALQTAQKADVKIDLAFDTQFAKLYDADINDYARSLLAMVSYGQNKMDIANALATQIENNCIQTGPACSWGGKSWHYNWQDDYVETTAFAVKSLVQVKYGSPAINSGIRYLLTQKRGNAWRSTKDTALIIFALVEYLEKSRELEPNYKVKIFLNDKPVFEKQMTKNDALMPEQSIRLNGANLRLGDNRIRIEKDGAGKFYSTFRSVYYAAGENLKASTTGFGVKREYFKLIRQPVSGGIQYAKTAFNGTLRSGDEVLVKVTVTSNINFEYFMLEDPLPAGGEVIKDESGYTIIGEPAFSGPRARGEYYEGEEGETSGPWYAAKEVRDEKVAFFATRLPAGRHEFAYLLRAQIPGDYHVMPTIATLMYYPEYQGNGDEARVRIVE
ncbi:MAG: MG2 domain-containing protein [candidate division KSB1 bacterium]|nr:MG2 domain-containing protein [candidate division KSB1 bacterium]MDZ7300724.1 MG2 domain-containing protein [candidate division KSB1 bacterium]MDZ7310006.1 MG2 domain-containing protein [candidate division KSB1 bacterium]